MGPGTSIFPSSSQVISMLLVLEQRSPNFLEPGTSFMEDNFSTDGCVWGGWFRRGCERRGAADEASLARPLLTSGCAARLLTGCGPVWVHGLGVGNPCARVHAVGKNSRSQDGTSPQSSSLERNRNDVSSRLGPYFLLSSPLPLPPPPVLPPSPSSLSPLSPPLPRPFSAPVVL